MEKQLKDLLKQAPELMKDNKGALLGAVIGYLLTDNEKAKSAILGAIAGSIIGDKNEKEF